MSNLLEISQQDLWQPCSRELDRDLRLTCSLQHKVALSRGMWLSARLHFAQENCLLTF